MWIAPIETRVKNILPTSPSPNLSTRRPIGIERRKRHNNGMGKNIQIM